MLFVNTSCASSLKRHNMNGNIQFDSDYCCIYQQDVIERFLFFMYLVKKIFCAANFSTSNIMLLVANAIEIQLIHNCLVILVFC